jgi:SAM-dependent methyltransferase
MCLFNPQQYWENRLGKSYGLHGVGYLGLGKNYNTWLYRVRRAVFLRSMRSLDRDYRNADVLDIGSGTGFYVDRWAELGVSKITGIDLTSVAVESLRRRYPSLRFCQLDISQNLGALGCEEFDYVSAFDVLFHIVDDAGYERAITNVTSALKPGGLFLWSDNFLHGNTQRGVHQVSRSLSDIEAILASRGLRVVQRRPMFYLMNAPCDTESRLHKKLWEWVARIVEKGELAGSALGVLLYPLELGLTAFAKEGPGTEMMICEKNS